MKGKQKVNPGKKQVKQVNSRSASTTKQECGRCNGPPHSRMKCPTRDSFCNICGRKGHWRKHVEAKLLAK